MNLTGLKILVAGGTGSVGTPIVRALRPGNEVHVLARFAGPTADSAVRATGAVPVPFDLANDQFAELDDDYDLVLNLAVRRSADSDFAADLATGAEAAGMLMHRCRRARAFLHFSSSAVYRAAGDALVAETDPLGDHHADQLPTYSLGRIAAEAVVRAAARACQRPAVIARLTVPYGRDWGWPMRHLEAIVTGAPIRIHPVDPMWFVPIHEADLLRQLPAMVAAAAVPATIVNWGGDEAVRLPEWCALFGDIAGVPPRFETDPSAFRGLRADTAKRRAVAGPCTVGWRRGFEELARTWLAAR